MAENKRVINDDSIARQHAIFVSIPLQIVTANDLHPKLTMFSHVMRDAFIYTFSLLSCL